MDKPYKPDGTWPADMEPEYRPGGVVPVDVDRQYDKPARGAHTNRAAALNVPCSEGPATTVFDRGRVSETELIAQESPIEPLHQMEAGTEPDDPAVRARLRVNDVPVRKPKIFW